MSTTTEGRPLYLHVDGIVCYACTGILEQLAQSVPGVLRAQASYVNEGLALTVAPDFAPAPLFAALEKHGYRARPVTAREASQTGDALRQLRRRILVSFFLSLLLIPYPFLAVPDWLRLLVATAVQLIAGLQFYRDAYYALTAGSANMSVLVSLGALTAYVCSAVSVLRGTGPVFFESCGSVLVLVMLGKYLERSARLSSSEAVQRLLEATPREATRLQDGREVRVDAATLRRGDCFLVRRGEIFPADGIILEGRGRVDESGLTGESRPAEKAPGDRVYATGINMDERFLVQADCDWDESVYAKMRRALLSGVNGEKAAIQKLADRVCSRFIPAVLLLAVLTLFLWYGFLAPGNWARAIRAAVAVLIVACPCAMGIATPLAVTAGMGALGKSGVYLKSPAALEALDQVQIVVFDKTGTLTLPLPDGGERLRAGARKTCETLCEMGMEIWLLSGDNEARVRRAATEAGISPDCIRFGLLPEEKRDLLEALRQRGKVCMVGDGLNDALSLQCADVGIAIGRASEVSMACADAVITHNKITHLLKALYTGRVTMRNIRRSLFWALIYNILGLLLCMFGIISPVVAGVAMSLSSLSVVLNAKSLDGKLQKLTFEKIRAAYAPKLTGADADC